MSQSIKQLVNKSINRSINQALTSCEQRGLEPCIFVDMAIGLSVDVVADTIGVVPVRPGVGGRRAALAARPLEVVAAVLERSTNMIAMKCEEKENVAKFK